jgi:hypothetical protein
VEPVAKDRAAKQSLCLGLFLSLRKVPQSIADFLPASKAKGHPQWTASGMSMTNHTNLFGPNDLNHCHLTRPLTLYYVSPTETVTATNNYWGTTDQDAIRSRVYDGHQNPTLGTLSFSPTLTRPVPIVPICFFYYFPFIDR